MSAAADHSRPIGDIIRELLRRKRFYEKGKYGALTALWEEMAGEAIASRTRISSFAGGELVIDVDSPALLHEMNGFLREQFLGGLRAAEGGRDVVSLRFRLSSGSSRPAAGL